MSRARKYFPPRVCPYCGEAFAPRKRNQATCGDTDCKREHKRKLMRKYNSSLYGKTIRAVCAICGDEFEYVSKGKRRKRCDRCRKYSPGSEARRVVPKADKICLFCGREFRTWSGAEFCGACVADGFDNVYAVRKSWHGSNWLSHGEKCRRAGKPDNGYRKGLRNLSGSSTCSRTVARTAAPDFVIIDDPGEGRSPELAKFHAEQFLKPIAEVST